MWVSISLILLLIGWLCVFIPRLVPGTPVKTNMNSTESTLEQEPLLTPDSSSIFYCGEESDAAFLASFDDSTFCCM